MNGPLPCPTPYNRIKNVLSASLNKTFPSFLVKITDNFTLLDEVIIIIIIIINSCGSQLVAICENEKRKSILDRIMITC